VQAALAASTKSTTSSRAGRHPGILHAYNSSDDIQRDDP